MTISRPWRSLGGASHRPAILNCFSYSGTSPVRIPRHLRSSGQLAEQRLVPEVAQHDPVGVTHADPAERELATLVEPPALVEEEDVYAVDISRP